MKKLLEELESSIREVMKQVEVVVSSPLSPQTKEVLIKGIMAKHGLCKGESDPSYIL